MIAKIIPPKVDYLKLNKTYDVNFTLVDDQNKKLAKSIPFMKVKFVFLRKVGNKWNTTYISPKNQTLTNNKAVVKIKTVNVYRIYNFKATIDDLKLYHIFYPPCDLEIKIITTSKAVTQGGIANFRVIVKNLGPGTAYNITTDINIPNNLIYMVVTNIINKIV